MQRFLGGNNRSSVIRTCQKIFNSGKYPIINYAVEGGNNKTKIYNEYKNLFNEINSDYKVAIKLSGLEFDKYLIDDVINEGLERNIMLLIDAENNKNISKYENIINNLMEKYNKDKCNLVKTYQMYRLDSFNTLTEDLEYSKKSNFFLGTKLCRGAYWNSEKNEGHLFMKKQDTDKNYNKAIHLLYDANDESFNMLATHNSESIDIGKTLNKHKNCFEFAHLLGMKEHKYNGLVEENKINVYVPYGPYLDMIPYLSRRMYENMDQVKYLFC